MLDLVIRGGQVVTPHGVGAWDVAIKGEKIVAVAAPDALRDAKVGRVIDASGKIVVPGGVDAHIHCKWPTRQVGEFSAPPATVSRAALFGGTTMFVDFAVWNNGQTLQQAVELRDADWSGQCCCDYAYHLLLHGAVPPEVVEQLPEMIQAGFPSVKMYTTDVRPPRTGWKMGFGDIWEVLQVLARHGGIACIHAEDDDLVMHMYRKLFREGRVGFENMSEVHSTLSEDLSFRRIIRLAESVEAAAVYLMHVSARTGVDAIRESRGRGYPIYGETLHQYALFSKQDYHRPNGQIYHTYPSLKDKDDQEALFDGMTKNGAMRPVSTDGICTPLSVKVKGTRIDDTTGGNVGVEPRLGVIYTEMVTKRKTSLERFVDVTSANPARIMGLFPRKGAIAVGSDADIAILDPAVSRKLRNEDLHESDYSPWEGYEVSAWPVITVLRGKIMVDDGQFFGDARDGKRITRKIADAILSGPAC